MSSGVTPAPSPSSSDSNKVWTPKSLLEWTEGYFRNKGIDTPRLDAEFLLAHTLGLKRLDLYLQFDRPLTPPELTRFRDLVKRRGDRTPVAYLTGEAGFWSLTLDMAPGCLIPRPDTETLVEAVLAASGELRGERKRNPDEEPAPESAGVPNLPAAAPAPLTVLELGVGSAAIPLAVCSEIEGVTWIGVDRSQEALTVARRNRTRHAALLEPQQNRLWLVRSDGLAALHGTVDMLVSNPPYIPTDAISDLMPEVSQHEPREALDGGSDGLHYFRLLITEAARRLRPDGRLLVEIGHDQLEGIRVLLAAEPRLAETGARRDLAGHVRVLDAKKLR